MLTSSLFSRPFPFLLLESRSHEFGPGPIPDLCLSGAAGRSRDGGGSRCFSIYSSFRLSHSVEEYGTLPFLSFSPVLTSGVRWRSSDAQARGPWRTAAVGRGYGDSSQNKYEGRLDLVNLGTLPPCSLCSHGGGRGVHGEFGSNFCSSAVASEMGLRRHIRGG